MLKHLGFLLAGLLLASTANAAEPAAAAPATWEAGKNYFLIDPPQPTSSGDKVEVLEVFSYACPHCAHFQPYAEQIKQSLPDYAAFGYMPAIFNAQSLLDCVVWGLIALVVQILVYWLVRLAIPDLSRRIAEGRMAPAVLLGAASFAVGIVNAAAMTY